MRPDVPGPADYHALLEEWGGGSLLPGQDYSFPARTILSHPAQEGPRITGL